MTIREFVEAARGIPGGWAIVNGRVRHCTIRVKSQYAEEVQRGITHCACPLMALLVHAGHVGDRLSVTNLDWDRALRLGMNMTDADLVVRASDGGHTVNDDIQSSDRSGSLTGKDVRALLLGLAEGGNGGAGTAPGA